MHICQGNYAAGKEYDAQTGHRYFDSGRYKADLIRKIESGETVATRVQAPRWLTLEAHRDEYILVPEDDDALRDYTRDTLGELGYRALRTKRSSRIGHP